MEKAEGTEKVHVEGSEDENSVESTEILVYNRGGLLLRGGVNEIVIVMLGGL